MLKPKVSSYKVVEGDCLWNIAQAQYGNPTVWPEIAEVNKLPDPDLILIGMTLRLEAVHDRPYHPTSAKSGSGTSGGGKTPQSVGTNPSPPLRLDNPHPVDSGPVPKSAHAAAPANSSQTPSGPSVPPSRTRQGTGTASAKKVSFPAVRYKLDDVVKPIVISTPEVDLVLRLIGEISIQQKGTMTEVELSQRGTLTGKLRADYDAKFANLIGQVKVGFNSQTQAAQVSCNLAVAAKMDGNVFATTQYEFIQPNRFKYSYKPTPIQGEWQDLIFSGNVGFELEVIFKKTDYGPPVEPMPAEEPVPVPARSGNTAWLWVVAGALVVAGVAIIVADVAKDIGTLGLGTVESPLSFAAAMALFAEAGATVP